MGSQDCDNRPSDLILHCKDILDLSQVALGPAVCASTGVDELRADADAITAAADAAFQHVADTQFATDLADIDRFALVLEAGVARDDEQLREPRQLHNDVICDAVREIALLGIAAHIGERKDSDRRLVGKFWHQHRLRLPGGGWVILLDRDGRTDVSVTPPG